MGAPIHLESRIDAVTVFRAGAVITRVADVPREGELFKLGPLPLGLDDGSVRVSVTGDDAPTATEVRVTLEVPDFDPSRPPARPEDVETAEQRVAKLRDQLQQLTREAQRIETLGVVTRPTVKAGREPPASPAEARMALLSLREKRLTAIDDRRDRIQRELRDAERKLADLWDRERSATNARRAEPHELRKAAVIALRGGNRDRASRVAVSYRIDAARWAPSYTLRLDRELREGTLEVRAAVCQRTGEDWDGVRLMLSTAEPTGWAELPELPSIRIGRRQPVAPKRGWRPPPQDTDALFTDYDRAAPPEPPVIAPTSTSVLETIDETPAEDQPSPKRKRAAGPPPAAAPVARAPMPPSAPAPQMAPQPAAELAARSMTRAGGVMSEAKGGLFGAVLDAFAEGGGGPAGGAGVADALEEEEAPLEASDELLDYGRLRLLAPHEGGRGRLVLQSRRELYVHAIETQQIEIDLSGALAGVDKDTSRCLARPLPGAHVAPSPSGYDYAYRASGRVNAPADGVFHNLSLSEHTSSARARFVVVPRESREAFRFVELDNPLDAPLLDGPIDVYVGEDFLLTSPLREVGPGGIVRLGLGVEQRLKVSRNARFEERSAGLMGGRLELEHEVEIEVSNQLQRTASVEVRERLPITGEDDDDVTVVDGEVSPAWEVWEPKDQPALKGGRRWRLDIPAGEQAKLRSRYTVKIASKHELVGGNRREP
ncbi:MAG: hypothetical protein SangKO_070440 [Sandaracinaceae bacterium]